MTWLSNMSKIHTRLTRQCQSIRNKSTKTSQLIQLFEQENYENLQKNELGHRHNVNFRTSSSAQKSVAAHPAATAHALEVGRQVALPMITNKVIRLKSQSIHEAFTTSWIKTRAGHLILSCSRMVNWLTVVYKCLALAVHQILQQRAREGCC